MNAEFGKQYRRKTLHTEINSTKRQCKEKGEVVSIIGGNGAGKSTLLKTISGLLTSRAGKISFEDHDIEKAPPEEIVARGIIHVPEGRRLFPLMTVKDNLLVGAFNKRARPQTQQTLADVSYNFV